MKVGDLICVADFHDLCPPQSLRRKIGVMEFGLYRMLQCAKKSEEKLVESVKSETSAVSSKATSVVQRSCGVAPSGASSARAPAVKQSLALTSSDSGEKETETVVEDEIPPVVDKDEVPSALTETWCCVENMPRESWLRRRRKHWPDQSRSTVFANLCPDTEPVARCDWLIHSKEHDERRHHFPGRRNLYIHYFYSPSHRSSTNSL